MINRRKTDEDGRYVRLLMSERRAYAGYHDVRSPGVESRFTSTNVDGTVSFLRNRARLIAESNAFVLGRVRTHRGGAALWVPNLPDYDKFLTEILVTGEDFSSGLSKCFIEKGSLTIDKDVPIVKLCVIRSTDKGVKDFILTISASHVIGEVSMIYSIWGMLNAEAEIKELTHDRIFCYRGWSPITGMKGVGIRKFLWFVLRSNASPLSHGKRPTLSRDQLVTTCCYINMGWVEEQKKAHDKSTPGVPYLSTQDIITAWFFRQWRTACVAVAFDMRHRCKRLTSEHMGNYLDALVLYPKEYCEPVNIRRAVASQGRWQPRRNKPGKENLRSVGAITGWHSKYVDLNLPYSQRINHLPIRSSSGELPLLKDPPTMILFKTSFKQFAMLSVTITEIKDKRALGEPIVF